MMQGTKIIVEQIEDAHREMLELTNAAKSKNRDLTETELARFTAAEINARNLLAKKAKTQQRMRAIAMSRFPNASLSSNYNPPERVLPTNGILPGDENKRYGKYCRVGKLRAFRDEQTAYDSGQWLKAVVARAHFNTIDTRAEDYCNRLGMEIVNTATEGTGSLGGFLVPSPLAQTIIEVRERVGVARQTLRIMPTSGDTLTVPKKVGGLTVYAPGEGNLITDSDKTWSQVELIIKKRAVASFLSQELQDDSIISIVDDLFSEMGYALALQEDGETINGNGAHATYFGVTGLLSSIGSAGVSQAATGHDTWSELDIADCAACVGKLPDRYHIYGPAWICSHSFYNQVFARIAYSAGGATMSELMSTTASGRSFMGYPCFLTSHMPTSTAAATVCALFGSFNQAAILADRGGIRIARSDDYKFLEDKITLKATSRYDIQVHDSGDATNAGAYVALKTTS